MSLDWNLTKIADVDTTCWCTDEQGQVTMNPVTELLIFASIIIGLADITAKNIAEWELRFEMLSQMGVHLGSKLADGQRTPWNPGRAELEAHIGLHTNAGPEKTRHQFKMAQMQRVEHDAEAAIRRRKKAQ